MNLKLDENLSPGIARLFSDDGHDVSTVRLQGLAGAEDQQVYEVCANEGRVLVTMDLDFSNPLRFPTAGTAGIIVLRPPRPFTPMIELLVRTLLPTMKTESVSGQLWIAETGRVRIYTPDEG